jgi:hypothetical protein
LNQRYCRLSCCRHKVSSLAIEVLQQPVAHLKHETAAAL